MKDKVAVAAGGGVVGWLAGLGMKPSDALEIANWLTTNLTPVGFVSFTFNILQAVGLYCAITYFGKRDDQKRRDVLGLVAKIDTWVATTHVSTDKFRETLYNLQIALAKGGIVVSQKE